MGMVPQVAEGGANGSLTRISALSWLVNVTPDLQRCVLVKRRPLGSLWAWPWATLPAKCLLLRP